MNNSQGALYFGAGIDTTQWKRDIESMRRDILGLNNTVRNETRQIDSSFKNLSLGIAGYFSVNALQGFAMELINVRGEFQKTEIAFSTMLGDAGKAKELMAQMVDLAGKTPFDLQDVSNGAKQLLAFQVPANEVVDTLTRMGNIAAGLSVPLARINLVYGQVKAKGKLMGDDLRQFTEAGIPMVAELAKKFGKTTSEISGMVSAGKIGFKDVKDVLFSLTDEGGMFFNLMEKQSKSLSGQIANLGDSWDQMLNKIGQSNEGLLSDGIAGLNYLVEHYEDVIQVVSTLVSVYGTYKAALIVTNALQKAAIWTEGTLAAIRFAQGISGMTKAQLLFNAAANANPYVLIASGIAAVVGAIVYLRTGNKQAKETTEQLTTAMQYQKSVTDSVGKAYQASGEKIVSSIDREITVLKSSYSSVEMRKKAYQNLININKSFIGTVDSEFRATKQLNEAYTTLVSRLKELAIAKGKAALLEELSKKKASADLDLVMKQDAYEKQRAENAKKRAENAKKDNLGAGLYRETMLNVGVDYSAYNPAKEAKKQREEITKQFNLAADEVSKGIAEANKKNDVELQKAWGNIGETSVEASNKGTQGWYEEEIKRMEEENKGLQLNAKKRLENLALIEKYNNLLNPKKEKKEKQLAEVFPVGSIKELEQQKQLLQDAYDVAINGQVKLRSLDKYGKDKDKNGNPYLTGQVISTESAYKQIEEINDRIKRLQNKSFDDQLSELERRIKVRDQLLENGYSKEVTDSMFPDIAGKNLLQSLQTLQANINQEISNGKGTERLAANYKTVTESIETLLGKQALLEKFNKDIENGMLNLKTASERLIYLKNQQDNLTDEDVSKGFYAELEKRITSEIDEQKRSYQSLLEEHQSYENKRNEISKLATEKRISILNDPKLNPSEKSQLTTSVTNQSNKQISELAIDELENSTAWKMLYQNIDNLTAYQIDKLLSALEANKDALASKMTPIDLRSVISKLRQAKQQLISQNPFQGMVTSFKLAIKGLGAETEQETQVAQENFEDAAAAVKATFQKVGDVAGSIEPFKEALGESGADAIEAITSFAVSAVTIAMVTKTTLKTIKDSIKNMEFSSVILAILQIVMMVIKAVISLVSWIWKMGDKKKERQIKNWANEVKNLKEQYDALKESIDRVMGETVYQQQTQMIANLREQQRLLLEMRDKEMDKKKTDSGKVEEYTSQINDINRQINEIYDNISKSITQTTAKDLASTLADALVEAYAKGENAALAYGKVADDVMKNAVKNALKMQLLEGPMQNVIKQLIKNMGFKEDGTGTFDGLTQDERDQIKAMMSEASNNYVQALNAYSDLFGDSAANAESLKGAVKGISEETADIIAGQMNAIRIMQAEALNTSKASQEVLRNQLLQLVQIEINTRYLKGIYEGIQAMRDKYGFRGVGIV